jgi:hypothetical protein
VSDSEDLDFIASEIDTSLRRGWFWKNEEQGVKSVQQILDLWYRSVGGNTVLLLNVPPDNRGHFADRDVKVLEEVGRIVRETFAVNLAEKSKITASSSQHGHKARNVLDGQTSTCWMPNEDDTKRELILNLEGTKKFNRIMIQEQIRDYSQRIVKFAVDVQQEGKWKQVVGYKRICRIPTVTTDKVRLRILDSRQSPTVSTFGLYYEAERLATPSVAKARLDIVKAKWKILTVSSEQADREPGRHAIDGNPNTIWHSRYRPDQPKHPRHIAVDLGEKIAIKGFTYLPRKDALAGTIDLFLQI